MATTRLAICAVLLPMILFATAVHATQPPDAIAAAKNNDTQFIHKQVAQDPTLVSVRDEQGYTPLHWAGIRGNWEIFQWLLEAEAPVNAKGGDGGTPLHWACHHDRADMIALLLERGADVTVHNRWGRSPLHVAVRRNCLAVAKLLLDSGANPNATTKEGWTGLHIAYRAGWAEMAQLLINNGADENQEDETGKKPGDLWFERPAAVEKSPLKLHEYTGKYDLGGGNGFKVWFADGQLRLQEFAPDILIPVGGDMFYCRQEPWVVKFGRNASGNIAAIEVRFLRRTVRGEKVHIPEYVGSEKCRGCHTNKNSGNQYVNWLSSKHAMAYWQLPSDWAKFLAEIKPHYADISEPQKERRCLMCHVTGAQDPNAFFALDFSETEGVGCETCHGPGSDYMAEDIMMDREKFLQHGGRIPDEKTCLKCHRAENFNFEDSWGRILHPVPKG